MAYKSISNSTGPQMQRAVAGESSRGDPTGSVSLFGKTSGF
jgi:hypothetical protein